MNIIKDKHVLDKSFPFDIERYALLPSDDDEVFHYHDYCEITYVESGCGMYFVNGRSYPVSPGDIVIFNNVEPHRWDITGSSMHVLVLTFHTDLVSDPADRFSGKYLKPFMERGSNFENKLGAGDAYTKIIYNIMLELFMEKQQKLNGYMEMIKADILRILTYLIRNYEKADSDNIGENIKEKQRSMKRLEKVFYYINDHFTEAVTLEDAAEIACMSPGYFSSYFKKVTSYTFSDYLIMMRLKKVRELYATTDKSITAIAMDCGFRNMSNFYRLYKKKIGPLPDRKTGQADKKNLS